jgi:phosphocarrier protein HPr
MTTKQPEDVMSQTVSREVIVANEQGLHARPADLVAREARRWQSRIEVVGKAQRVDGKSILDLLTLAAEAGTRLVLEATGPDASEALDALGSLFEQNFTLAADSTTHTENETVVKRTTPANEVPGEPAGERGGGR